MTTKSKITEPVVKTRKILAPDAELKAQLTSHKAPVALPGQAQQLKKTSQAEIGAIKPVNNASARREKAITQKPSIATEAPTARPAISTTPASRPRNLRAGSTAVSTSPVATTKKTQAQLAREKLAAAAAKRMHIDAQDKVQATLAKAQAAQAQAKARAAKAEAKLQSQAKAQESQGSQESKVRANVQANGIQQSASPSKQQPTDSANQPAGQPPGKPANQMVVVAPQERDSRSDKRQEKHGKQEAGEEAKKPPIITATALLAAKYPNYVADHNDLRTKTESRVVFFVSSLILALIAFGWMQWTSINFQAGGDFTYNSGLVGGIAMALVLIYALRKRVRSMRKAGTMEFWYYYHLLGGVLGPLVIVFHSGFTIKSINSGVALFTMIAIVLSGLFGRYIYTRIGFSLHRKLLLVKELETQLLDMLHSYDSPVGERIERRLSNFALSCLTGPRSIIKLPMRLIAVRGSAAACYVKASAELAAMNKSVANRENLRGAGARDRLNAEKEQLREYIGSVSNIALAHMFERILVKWRILHIPLLYILVITSLFHVLAVHMY